RESAKFPFVGAVNQPRRRKICEASRPARATRSHSGQMRPSIVLLGFVLGSAASITFSLGGVTVVYLILQGKYPRLAAEFPTVLVGFGMFAALTVIAGASFYGQLKQRPWRAPATALLALGLAAIGWYYWPE